MAGREGSWKYYLWILTAMCRFALPAAKSLESVVWNSQNPNAKGGDEKLIGNLSLISSKMLLKCFTYVCGLLEHTTEEEQWQLQGGACGVEGQPQRSNAFGK
ncbi:hypothetical protein DNTS_032455 [Danionella cerebrum]|uniref:Uncharacterized protein n=1 Tax=Danionella cerebrum TaxID=2873325 RepID=A0A553QK03_9TELE|nr:hypothetical protein DNTS_032455 [Danionella translucida]